MSKLEDESILWDSLTFLILRQKALQRQCGFCLQAIAPPISPDLLL
ncbi:MULTISPECIES: hypothetical protein [Kamptonema]|nr:MULTISPECIES: hypothetical protein [Kamptonema]